MHDQAPTPANIPGESSVLRMTTIHYFPLPSVAADTSDAVLLVLLQINLERKEARVFSEIYLFHDILFLFEYNTTYV